MNARDYRIHLDGYAAAARGSGLSDSPHGGRDGDLWRGGVRSWLDEHDDQGQLGSLVRMSDTAPDAANASMQTETETRTQTETEAGLAERASMMKAQPRTAPQP